MHPDHPLHRDRRYVAANFSPRQINIKYRKALIRRKHCLVCLMRISIVGGGYVGLVSAVCLAKMGNFISLIEINDEKVASINLGQPTLHENGLGNLLSSHLGTNLKATTEYSGVSKSDITIICVGTPSAADGSADLSMIVSASRSIGNALKESDKYTVVAVKSTVPPGTTENLVMPEVLAHSGRSLEDIGFVMNPEFLREGLAIQDFMNPDRIIIGSSDNRAGDFFEPIYNGLKAPCIRTSIRAAEMIKYASNAFLATKISFSNEIGNICKRLGIDIYEVMKGVGLDHRISPHFLNAGAGFGGSCFPKDVSALIKLAKEQGEDPVLLNAVMKINELQPLRMIDLLKRRVGSLRGKRIAVIGLSFKNDTNDIRESRAIPVIEELLRSGAEVMGYDPVANEAMRRIFPEVRYCSDPKEALIDADGCMIMTEWPQFGMLDLEFDLMRSRVIIEGRRILKPMDAEGICW
jgi:UDPglucose 6-dehydrogenase